MKIFEAFLGEADSFVFPSNKIKTGSKFWSKFLSASHYKRGMSFDHTFLNLALVFLGVGVVVDAHEE